MTDVQFIKMLKIIDHYTTTKINEVLDDVEEAIGEDDDPKKPPYTDHDYGFMSANAKNHYRKELRQKLSQIRKEKVNE